MARGEARCDCELYIEEKKWRNDDLGHSWAIGGRLGATVKPGFVATLSCVNPKNQNQTHEIRAYRILYPENYPCTGCQSRIVLSPLPRLIIINRIHTLEQSDYL